MKDPIVEEMRHNFDELAKRFNYDVQRLSEYFQQQQAKHPERLASQVRRQTPKVRVVSGARGIAEDETANHK